MSVGMWLFSSSSYLQSTDSEQAKTLAFADQMIMIIKPKKLEACTDCLRSVAWVLNWKSSSHLQRNSEVWSLEILCQQGSTDSKKDVKSLCVILSVTKEVVLEEKWLSGIFHDEISRMLAFKRRTIWKDRNDVIWRKWRLY